MATGRVPTTANSPLTTKGDLFGYSTAPARLAVGNNGETIVADSSTATGLRYQEPLNLNPILNSGFDIWQRGTSIAQTAAIMYGADRWCSNRGGLDTGSTISRQATGDTTNLPNIQYCARVQRNSGTTSTSIIYFSQTIESVNSIPFAGKIITFSFYARAGANYSSASSALSVTVSSGTGTDQNILSTYTGAASAIGGTQTATLTTTWQRFTYTGTVATNATELGMYFNYTPVGTAGAADYFEITGVMINVGSVAYPFRRTTGTIQGELAACQRYYYRAVSLNSSAFPFFGNQYTTSSTVAYGQMILPVPMRVFPTSIETIAASNYGLQYASGRYGCTAISLDTTVNFSTNNSVPLTVTTTGATAGNVHFLVGNNTSSAYVGVSAEL